MSVCCYLHHHALFFLFNWCLVPVTGPHDIHVMRLSSSQITVSWQPLSLEEARGFITKYTVTAEPTTLTRRRQEGTLSVSVEHNATRVVLDGLSPNLAYSVSVSASTTVGTSSNNNITIVGALGKTTLPVFNASLTTDSVSTLSSMSTTHIHFMPCLHKRGFRGNCVCGDYVHFNLSQYISSNCSDDCVGDEKMSKQAS